MIFAFTVIFSAAAQANPIKLTVNSFTYGPLSQDTNGPVNEVIEFIRTTQTSMGHIPVVM